MGSTVATEAHPISDVTKPPPVNEVSEVIDSSQDAPKSPEDDVSAFTEPENEGTMMTHECGNIPKGWNGVSLHRVARWSGQIEQVRRFECTMSVMHPADPLPVEHLNGIAASGGNTIK